MSDSPSTPQPVDPYTQAAAQYGLSTGTAQFNAGLNRTNNVNPMGGSYWSAAYPGQGSGAPGSTQMFPGGGLGGSGLPTSGGLTGPSASGPGAGVTNAPPAYTGNHAPYTSIGGNGMSLGQVPSFGLGAGSATGTQGLPGAPNYSSNMQSPTGGAPTYTQYTSLAPQFQDALNKPIDTSGLAGMPGGPSTTQDLQNTQDALYQKQMQYLQPEQDLQSSQLQSQLANEGATIGSPAYNNEMARMSRQQQAQTSDARTQAITGAGAEQSRLFGLGTQGLTNQITARNAPLNEYETLAGNGAGAQATAQTPDISGAFAQNYQGALNSANAQTASNNQTESSLASAAMLAAMFFSDRRLKEDIRKVGKTDDGLPVYTYKYKGDSRTQMGVMAQDVEKDRPEAVFSLGGRGGPKMVDYGAIS